MLNSEIEYDRYDNKQWRLSVNQGDSYSLISTPIDKNGEKVSLDLIDVARFKIYDKATLECLYCKEGTKYNGESFLIRVPADENILPINKYKYEVEYTMVDGSINTTNQWYFDILEQSYGGCE